VSSRRSMLRHVISHASLSKLFELSAPHARLDDLRFIRGVAKGESKRCAYPAAVELPVSMRLFSRSRPEGQKRAR